MCFVRAGAESSVTFSRKFLQEGKPPATDRGIDFRIL
jgi:hypothetical protein